MRDIGPILFGATIGCFAASMLSYLIGMPAFASAVVGSITALFYLVTLFVKPGWWR